VVRHSGRAVGNRSQSPLGSGTAQGVAVLTAPGGIAEDELRLNSGRLTPAFGLQVGTRRYSHDVPAFGSPEHSALMTGSLDLDAIERAAQTGPLVGFAPIVLDPHGPASGDLPPRDASSRESRKAPRPTSSGNPGGNGARVLPSRRSLRAAPSSALGRPLSTGVLPGSPRSVPPVSGATLLPPLGSPATTGALRVRDVEEALAARHTARPATDDPTPTGELARPFVAETALTEWSVLEDVPPPVSVDVFQRAMRAGVDLDDAESLKALDDDESAASSGGRGGRAGRSRRELRARERAANSTRSITARRLAKGGVLAITALGVVSSATPQGLTAFGLTKGDTPRNTVDFATAISPDTSAPVLTTLQVEQLRSSALAGHLRNELSAAKAADALRAGMQTGDAAAGLALQQDNQVLAAREAARQRAIRDVINDPQAYARILVSENGWGSGQFQCLVSLWNRESQWNYRAVNASSNAYGIAQALPGSKMNSVGADWRTNPVTQIKWGLQYIESRYGTPCGAWAHSQATGWY
jgi:Transglycosylase SLT domain